MLFSEKQWELQRELCVEDIFTGDTWAFLSVSRVLVTEKPLWLERSLFTIMHIEYCFAKWREKIHLLFSIGHPALMFTHGHAVSCDADYKDTHIISDRKQMSQSWNQKQTACPSPSMIPAATPPPPISRVPVFLCSGKSRCEVTVAYA